MHTVSWYNHRFYYMLMYNWLFCTWRFRISMARTGLKWIETMVSVWKTLRIWDKVYLMYKIQCIFNHNNSWCRKWVYRPLLYVRASHIPSTKLSCVNSVIIPQMPVSSEDLGRWENFQWKCRNSRAHRLWANEMAGKDGTILNIV